VLSVEPQVRVGTLKRARPELLDMLVEVAAQAADAVFVYPRDPSCSTRRSTLRVLTPLT